MKKLASVLLALTMAGAFATGCDKSKETRRTTEKKTTTEQVETETSSEETTTESITSSETTETTIAPTEEVIVDQNVKIGMYSFTVNSMWMADQWDGNVFVAHPKDDKEGATLQILCKETNSNVTYKTLRRNAKNGKMDDLIAEPYDSCENIQYEEYDNGISQGIKFTADYKKGNEEGSCVVLLFPDEANHAWVEVRMDQPKNAKNQYVGELDTIGGTASAEKNEIPEETQTTKETKETKKTESTATPTTTVAPSGRSDQVKSNPAPDPGQSRDEQAAELAQYLIELVHNDNYGMSRSQLVKKIQEAGYTKTEAETAANNCGLDWKAEAVKTAKYQQNEVGKAGSRQEVIDELMIDQVRFGFTKEEATYAADHSGIDYYENAVIIARVLVSLGCTSSKAYEWLLEYGFTKDQAQKAINDRSVNWGEAAIAYANEVWGPLSKKLLIQLLTKDAGFSKEEAEYAAEHGGYDWNSNAVWCANFIAADYDIIFPNEFIWHLTEVCGYTEAEAKYGMNHSDINWKKEQKKAVSKFVKETAATPNSVKNKLIESGYPADVAVKIMEENHIDWDVVAEKYAEYKYNDILDRNPRIKRVTRETLMEYLINEGFSETTAGKAVDKVLANY